MEDNNLISLKEASIISGYSPDYIGQLIRGGKIPGKQIYCNVAWMTTADAILSYKNNGEKTKNDKKIIINPSVKTKWLNINIEAVKILLKTFKPLLPLFILMIVCFFVISFFIVYNIFDYKYSLFYHSSANKDLAFKNLEF